MPEAGSRSRGECACSRPAGVSGTERGYGYGGKRGADAASSQRHHPPGSQARVYHRYSVMCMICQAISANFVKTDPATKRAARFAQQPWPPWRMRRIVLREDRSRSSVMVPVSQSPGPSCRRTLARWMISAGAQATLEANYLAPTSFCSSSLRGHQAQSC